MAAIYIIAGPPGVGKSTNGFDFIPEHLDIINEDDTRLRYKAKGFADYNEYAIYRVRDIIKQKLIQQEDFALELNLGFPNQYDYAASLKKFSSVIKLHVILFFTNDLQLCLDRARERHLAGLHLVDPNTVTKMYNNTMPLLADNFAIIDDLLLVDVSPDNTITPVAHYDRQTNRLTESFLKTDWYISVAKPIIAYHIGLASGQ